MKYDTISDNNIDNAIVSAVSARGASNKVIQNILISILIHVDTHGEPSKANKIVAAMDSSDDVSQADTNAVRQYLGEFGKLAWDKDAKIFVHDKSSKTLLNETKGAKATMWWSFKPKAAAKGFDYDEEIGKLNKKAAKQIAKQAALIAEGKSEDALEISVNLKHLQAVRIVMQELVKPDAIIELAKEVIAKQQAA